MMSVAFVGRSVWTDDRILVVKRWDPDVREYSDASSYESSPDETATEDIVFLSVPSDELALAADSAIRRMSSVFFDTRHLLPLRDARALMERASEAGVQLSYSRPMWFDETAARLRSDHVRVLSISSRLEVGSGPDWRHGLRQAADLCGDLCGTFATSSIEAGVVRDGTRVPVMVVFTVRFLNGALAQVHLGATEEPPGVFSVVAASESGVVESHIEVTRELVEAETRQFVAAAKSGGSVPFEFRSGIEGAKMVEDILARLR